MAATETRTGILYGLACYGWWGIVVVYFKWVDHVAPLELLAHRVSWSFVLIGLLLAYRRRWAETVSHFRQPRVMLTLVATTLLVATNWFTFLWAVIHEQVVQASLGYFINPLFNVVLGFVFLRERLRRPQVVAVALAALGVTVLTIRLGQLPVISLVLAGSFGMYGLLRKTARVDSLVGLTLETLLLLPFTLGYLVWLQAVGSGDFGQVGRSTDVLLILSGAVTALPLLWFAHAARRLPLTTLGLLMYIAPSLQLGMGVLVFDEPFTWAHAVAFGCIWSGLALYSWDSLRHRRVRVPPAPGRPADAPSPRA